jgi:bifunctional lysine-specific demethylase and histidyl-hydroxylase NO66
VTSGAALARLVGDVPRFLDHVRRRRPLFLSAGADPTATSLLTLDDVDHLVAASGLRAPSFRMVREGRTLPTASLTRRVRIGSRPVSDLVDVPAVRAAFAEGATLVLQGLHRSWPPVSAVCRELEAVLTHPLQANAYLTPPVAQGLDLHADPHDVLAVQTHGRKRWVVHPPDADGDPWDLELRPGDVLYLPAGTRHAAQTVDEPSLHLTLGIRTVRWRDVLRRALDEAVADDRFDGPLPPGWAEDPAELASALHGHLDVLRDRLRDGDGGRWLEAEAETFRSRRPIEATAGLRDLLEADAVEDGSVLHHRPGPVRRRTHHDGRVELVLSDRRLRLPTAIGPAVDRVLATDPLRPADLDDLLDAASRLVLCRRLVREGVLGVERSPATAEVPGPGHR